MSQSVGIPLYSGEEEGGGNVQGHPTKGSYIYQLPPDAVYHPHLRTTPTVELSHQTAPSWQRGGGRMAEMRGSDKIKRGKRKKRKKEGETRRVGFREAVSHLLALILFARWSCLSWQRQRCMGREEKKKKRGTMGVVSSSCADWKQAVWKRPRLFTREQSVTRWSQPEQFFVLWALGVPPFF